MTRSTTLAGGVAALCVLAGAPAGARAQEARTCRPCHAAVVERHGRTAHATTSAVATAQTIRGRFGPGHGVLRTRRPGVFFRLERRADGHYQVGVDSARSASITKRFDLVIGSGRRGQSYLYWKQGLLYQLPVSWLAAADGWINSPGYEDGRIDFGRVVPLRCLECHATAFRLEPADRPVRLADDYTLGISCRTCHGDGREHAAWHAAHPRERTGRHIVNPARLPRERRLDNCALCHSGPRALRRPPFTYRPGDNLADYHLPLPEAASARPDVHGDQVGLLRASRCFQASPAMTCATCHDAHTRERSPVRLAARCLSCHDLARHPRQAELGARLREGCIDCHMPAEASGGLQIMTASGPRAIAFRTHAIGKYPDATARVLKAAGRPAPRPRG